MRTVIRNNFSVLRDGNVRNLFLGQITSGIGDQFNLLVTSFWIYKLSGSAFYASLLPIAKVISIIFLGAFVGTLADRCDARKMYILVTALQAIVTLLMFCCNHIHFLIASSVLMNILGLAATSSRGVLKKTMLTSGSFKKLNSVSTLIQTPMAIIMPAIAAAVVSTIEFRWAYFIDAISFMVALCFYSRIKSEDKNKSNDHLLEKKSSITHILDGMKYITNNKQILFLLTMIILGNMGFCAFHYVYVLGQTIASKGVIGVGVVNSAMAVGGFIMSSALAFLNQQSFSSIRTLSMVSLLNGLATTIFLFTTDIIPTVLLVVLISATDEIVEMTEENILFDIISERFFGVVNSYLNIAHRIISLLFIPIYGLAVDKLGIHNALGISGFFIIFSGIIGILLVRKKRLIQFKEIEYA
ncbi:MAG: MFS transporter [Oligoflexia bacterium]|nr:MFS transporter [Oligoflexia bacterium]